MDKLFVFSLCFYFCLAKITIKHLNVPASVSVDEEEVILDCEFDDQDGEVEEIKWFINGQVEQIYQWLPKRKEKPQALRQFTNITDTTYKATKNTTTMYRAMRITNLTPDLSGNYTCKVSGLHSEDFKTKRMIIYDPADYDLALNVTGDDDELTIECSAEGIFPEPEMTLLIAHYNESNIIIEDETEITELNDEDNSYSIESNITVDLDNLISPVYYTCKLSIPGTDYGLNKTGTHYFEIGTDTQSEEDNLNIFDSTNSTESTIEESQESDNSTLLIWDGVFIVYQCCDSTDKENDTIRRLPSLSLITTLLLTMLSASYA